MRIKELLRQPESKVLEFKRDVSSLSPIIKTVIAFANTAGGILIIGQESNGKIVGLSNIFKAEEQLANAIADNIQPALMPDIEIATVDNKDLLVVKVGHWKTPFFYKKEGIPNGIYIRLGSTSRPAGPELIAELQRSVTSTSYDQSPISSTNVDDLDFSYIEKIYKDKHAHFDENKLVSLGVLTPFNNRHVPTIGGVILFGKEEIRNQYVPDARVDCARFLGTTKSKILDRMQVKASILNAIEEVSKFISRNTRLEAEIKTFQRKDIPEYPTVGIREALINAIAHADYSLLGSRIKIAIYDDRLEIQNPGMFPFGYTMDDFIAGISKARNRVIVRTLNEIGFMEEWGSGYKRIHEFCNEHDYPNPKWEEFGAALRVTFYPFDSGHYVSENSKFVLIQNLSERERLILSLFQVGDILPFKDIYSKLTINISERMLRYNLVELAKKGVLALEGKGPNAVWKRIK